MSILRSNISLNYTALFVTTFFGFALLLQYPQNLSYALGVLLAFLALAFLGVSKVAIGIAILVTFPEYVPGKILQFSPFDFVLIPLLFLNLFVIIEKGVYQKFNPIDLVALLLIFIIVLFNYLIADLGLNVRREFIFFALFIFLFTTVVVQKTTDNKDFQCLRRELMVIASAMLFSACTLLLLGFGDERFDNTVIFYGHPYGILTAILIYELAKKREVAGLLITISVLGVLFASFQSAHLLLFLVAFLLGLRPINIKVLLLLFIISTTTALILIYAVNVSKTGTWSALKFGQLHSLMMLEFNNYNSVAIRFAEFRAVFFEVGLLNKMFGLGVGSIYPTDFAEWQNLKLHSATFPDFELTSQEFSYLHEPMFLMQKWFGILGLCLVLQSILKRASLFYIYLFFMFSLSSTTAAILLIVLAIGGYHKLEDSNAGG